MKKKGIKVDDNQVCEILQFVHEFSPWFPDQGSLDIDNWDKVGEDIRYLYESNGPQGMSVNALAYWSLSKQALAPMEVRDYLNVKKSTETSPQNKSIAPLLFKDPLERRLVMRRKEIRRMGSLFKQKVTERKKKLKF